MKKVIIHSDGACHGNPGPGGWAATLVYGPHQKELSGGVPATTNSRMELQAALEGLSILKEPCEVELYTDSEYLRNGMTAWLFHWKRNGWKTKAKATGRRKVTRSVSETMRQPARPRLRRGVPFPRSPKRQTSGDPAQTPESWRIR